MFSIRISQLKNGLTESDTQNIGVCDSFCGKSILNTHMKCHRFYLSVLEQDKPYFVCPYGYVCYKPESNCETILTAIICEKSNNKKIKERDKIGKTKSVNPCILADIIERFDRFNDYIYYVSICSNICHDLNNALNYLLDIADVLDNDEDNEAVEKYKIIIQEVGTIQQMAVYEPFNELKKYTPSGLKQKTKSLLDLIDGFYEFAERRLKAIDSDNEQNRYCFYSGFSLLRTLLRRNLMIAGEEYASKGTIRDFSLHKMVKKIVSILKYKAKNKNVSFPQFSGSPQKRVVNNIDNVFTAIFTIIDNAVKYSFENENIFISFIENNEELVLAISNKSNPLTEEDLAHIHQKGYRGSNKTKKGHGLGLFLVKTICDDCGIGYEASYVNGTFTYEFHFRNLIEGV